MIQPLLKLTVYVPATHLEIVKDAIFGAGAGRVGDYDRCAWQVAGEGQFRPLAGASPFLGEVGREERVLEYRVETVLREADLHAVVAALKAAHPYETPAYDVVRVLDI